MHFEYNGVSSWDYDLIIASVKKARDLTVSGKADIVSMYNRRTTSRQYLNTTYDNAALTYDMEVVGERPLSHAEQRQITKWLFHQPGYRRLYFDYNDDIEGEWFDIVDGEPIRTYLNCIMTEPEVIEGYGGICGYRFKVICDGPTAWTDEMTVTEMPVLGTYDLTYSHETAEHQLELRQANAAPPLLSLPMIPAEMLVEAGWGDYQEDVRFLGQAIAITIPGGDSDGTKSASFTPVRYDENGKIIEVLEYNAFSLYARGVLMGNEDTNGLLLSQIFTGENAFQDAQNVTYTLHYFVNLYYDGEDVIDVNVDTDMNEYVYPVLSVLTAGNMADGSAPAFKIWNASDDTSRVLYIENVATEERIVFDGNTNYVSGNHYTDVSSPNFLRLVDGVNEIHVAGSVDEISLTWKNRRYV